MVKPCEKPNMTGDGLIYSTHQRGDFVWGWFMALALPHELFLSHNPWR